MGTDVTRSRWSNVRGERRPVHRTIIATLWPPVLRVVDVLAVLRPLPARHGPPGTLGAHDVRGVIRVADPRASEELLAAPLPDLVKGLGLAVADANEALSKAGTDVRYTIPEAEVELKVALSISKSTETGVAGGVALHAFSVNAAYTSTYSFSEQASSSIRLVLRAMPPTAQG